MEVLRLVARSMSNMEIAKTRVRSEATVKTHAAGILAKLDLPRAFFDVDPVRPHQARPYTPRYCF
jgi:DNA-binding NarL/FixJ family response regulator